MKIKEYIYHQLVRVNDGVKNEYERYVIENIDEHYKHRLKHWKLLARLNWHYRILGKSDPLIFTNEKSGGNIVKPCSNTKKSQEGDKVKKKLPYLRGSESKLHNNKEAHYIAKDCMSYDVISFDIFDTLICRPFMDPKDVFYIVGKELGLDSFRKLRIKAEIEARNYAEATRGNREVTIYDIYRYIHLYTNIDVEEGVKMELEVEKELCFPNEQMKRVFNLLKFQGKRIILASNMYLPESMLKELLDKCGITGYEKLFVSCDYQASKRTGTLYKNILSYVGESAKVIHIGDDHEADFLKAREMGIASIFYKNVNKAGRQYRADGMSELVGSAYGGIVNYHLHNGKDIYSKPYEYGFIYGGLYVLGYCSWIHKFATENKVDKIIFLSRDGKIYQRIFDQMYQGIPSEYMYWSRIANLKYTADNKHGKYYFLLRVIDDRVNGELQSRNITIKELLNTYGLNSLLPLLKDMNLKGDMVLTKENANAVKIFLHQNWNKILLAYSEEVEVVKHKIKKIVNGCKKVAIIDVGWNGTGPLGIKYLIEEKWNWDCHVYCLLAGSKVADHTANLNELQNEDIIPYLFARNLNRANYDVHANTNNGTNSIYFELFTQDDSPSFSGVTKDGDYIFELPEIENYEDIREIQKGIEDFAIFYKEKFQKYPYMYNISGHDAYCPFRMIIKDLWFIKRYFANFIYSRTVGNSFNNYSFWKLGDLFEKLNL